MKNRILVKTAASVLCMAAVLSLCSCLPFKPPKPGKRTIENNVRKTTGLDVRLVKELGDDKYLFEDNDRGIEFMVTVKPEPFTIDGSSGGYTGKYYYNIDYEYGIFDYYQDDFDDLADAAGLVVIDEKDDLYGVKVIDLVIDTDISEEQMDAVNAFLRGLRDIAEEEEDSGYDFYSDWDDELEYEVHMYWVETSGSGEQYYFVDTGNGVILYITADTKDSDLDIRNMGVGTQISREPKAGGLIDVVLRADA